MKTEEAKRLEAARIAAGYESAVEAAKALGINDRTYTQHENGLRGFKKTSAKVYARKFGVNVDWLYLNQGPQRGSDKKGEIKTVPLMGYVGAGSETHFFNESGELESVVAPDRATEDTVAVEIRGESLGPVFDRWLAFYDNVEPHVTNAHINNLCVVGLADGRILIKKIQRSKEKGLFHLISNGFEPPILDVEIEWAAKVIDMRPR